RQDQALRGWKPERRDVACEHQQAGETLPALHDAEFGRLLDRVNGVTARVGEADDLRLRRLCLQQERGEVVGVERVTDLAEHLASRFFDGPCRVTLERVAESVVG